MKRKTKTKNKSHDINKYTLAQTWTKKKLNIKSDAYENVFM